ncbi:MAG: c-type cytochrome, partial [Solirubrobacteraceae bacterium]
MADAEPGPAAPADEPGADELLGRLQGHLRRASQAAEGLRSEPASQPAEGLRSESASEPAPE